MYDYKTERSRIFTEEGQEKFIKIRDNVHELLKKSGACTIEKAISGVSGDSWLMLACVDRLVELGEIREVGTDIYTPGQYRVFVKNE